MVVEIFIALELAVILLLMFICATEMAMTRHTLDNIFIGLDDMGDGEDEDGVNTDD